MNQVTTLLFAVVAWTVVAAMVALRLSGLTFPAGDVVQPAVVCAALIAGAYWYRRVPNFCMCFNSLAVLVAFSTAFVVLMYAVASNGRPMADAALAHWESTVGISSLGVQRWVAARPWLATALWFVYFSLMPQTMLAIMVLGLKNSPALSRFLLQFMLGALVTVVCFYFAPAIGSCDQVVPDHYVGIIKDLTELNSGQRQIITWRGAEGIITFPSFHVVWAVLLSLALRWRWVLILNGLVIFSTIPVGLHYVTDIVGGLLVCAIVVPLSDRMLAHRAAGGTETYRQVARCQA